MRDLIDAAFVSENLVPTIAVESEQREAIVALVRAGAGASILPRPVADAARESGVVTVALSPPVRRTIGLVWRAGPVSPAAQAFIDLSRNSRTEARDIRDVFPGVPALFPPALRYPHCHHNPERDA